MSLRVIYCCGDSHSLSSAWQAIAGKSKETVLVPKLVTGRPDSIGLNSAP
ncbi:hypothetical protein T484DRAFT_1765712 [Baffinella frigidus]|nr:hypothetical protein T484DRAFT_1765712 [Cryptophyta sp. CCMP2293]